MSQMTLFDPPARKRKHYVKLHPEVRQTAQEARDEGMRRGAEKVDRAMPKWYELAVEAIRQYALTHPEFMCEAVRSRAEAAGMPKVKDKRAWGSAMTKAAKAGYVRKVGLSYATDPKVHMNPAGLWKSLIHREGAR